MILYEVVENIKIKTPGGIKSLNRGQIIKLPEISAKSLIESGKIKPLPYLTRWGTVVIPHNSPCRYHWWNHGQSIKDTLRELGASDEILKRYKSPYSTN